MNFPHQVKITEVGPRDGLQNEAILIPTETKIEFINRLSKTGLRHIEATSFVSPQRIPQTADHSDVFRGIEKQAGVSYPVLVPNLQGFNKAIECGAQEVAFFTAVSETFTQHNINCSIEESLARLSEFNQLAIDKGIKIRGYISCCLGCPYEGDMPAEKSRDLARQLIDLGCYEISLGDTIGIGTPHKAQQLIRCVTEKVTHSQLAIHFHNTYGQALANIYACLELGIQNIDASVTGLGGCPYAPGASGNVATEEVLFMLDGLGISTGISRDKLLQAGEFLKKSNSW